MGSEDTTFSCVGNITSEHTHTEAQTTVSEFGLSSLQTGKVTYNGLVRIQSTTIDKKNVETWQNSLQHNLTSNTLTYIVTSPQGTSTISHTTFVVYSKYFQSYVILKYNFEKKCQFMDRCGSNFLYLNSLIFGDSHWSLPA